MEGIFAHWRRQKKEKTRKSLTENLVWYLLLHLIFINVFIKTLTIIPYIGIIRALELLTFD